jgi:nucleotide-binding universal stress UspA family protein
MTPKTILVHAGLDAASDRRVSLAVRLADLFQATILGVGAEAFDPVFASVHGTERAVIEALRARIARDLPAAEGRFHELTAGARAEWRAFEAYPGQALVRTARGADLIVAGRPSAGDDLAHGARPADLVMEAGIPILVAADDDAAFTGDRIVVAWKDCREARRAMSDALPFLVRAQEVILVSVLEGLRSPAAAELGDIVQRLARHGVKARIDHVTRTKGSVADALDDAAQRHGADLIVAGAYGRSRLQEWALGGVTEDLIAASPRFVMLSH